MAEEPEPKPETEYEGRTSDEGLGDMFRYIGMGLGWMFVLIGLGTCVHLSGDPVKVLNRLGPPPTPPPTAPLSDIIKL